MGGRSSYVNLGRGLVDELIIEDLIPSLGHASKKAHVQVKARVEDLSKAAQALFLVRRWFYGQWLIQWGRPEYAAQGAKMFKKNMISC